MTKIGLISDPHASAKPVAEALAVFARAGVQQVWCAGDIAGYMDELDTTIELLQESHCITILGNHDLLYLDHLNNDDANTAADYLRQLPASYEAQIDGKRLYMVHAQPPDECHGGIKLRDKSGIIQADRVAGWAKKLETFDYDVLVVGHTHQVFAEVIAGTLVINPGSSAFNHSCAILSLPGLQVEFLPLSGKAIEQTWNWGQHVIYGRA